MVVGSGGGGADARRGAGRGLSSDVSRFEKNGRSVYQRRLSDRRDVWGKLRGMAGRGLHLCVGRCPGRAQRLSRGRRVLGELAPPPAEPVAHGYWKELVSQLPFLRARKVRKQDYSYFHK